MFLTGLWWFIPHRPGGEDFSVCFWPLAFMRISLAIRFVREVIHDESNCQGNPHEGQRSTTNTRIITAMGHEPDMVYLPLPQGGGVL